MQKVKILKDYKGYVKGYVVIINANEAHALIEGGIAELYKVQEAVYEDKMMKPRRKHASR